MASSNPLNSGAYVNTTNVWDVQEVFAIENLEPQLRELLVRLYQNLNIMANVVNVKDSGFYQVTEFLNSQQWFPNPALSSATSTYPANRNVLRKVINFGALPNAGSLSVNHNIPINAGYTFTRIYGAASNTTGLTYIPLPYASSVDVAHNIELSVSSTQVTITTGSNYSSYATTYVILEYIRT